jgi:outer membrane lipopolysaccharide assembly protein LptE/RlpB
MLIRTQRIILLSAALLLNGCVGFHRHQKPSILPPYIHKIAVRPFSNHTQQYGLEDKLTLAVQSEFNLDGRYQVTTEDQADGVLFGEITRYTLEPLSYDANHVPTEYKLTIPVDISFTDKVKNQVLWKEPGMIGEFRYFVASSGLAGAMTETDAQQVIWDELSRDILTRTIEGSGSEGGSTDKSGSKSSSNTSHAPPPLDNNPPPMPSEQPSSPPSQQPY